MRRANALSYHCALRFLSLFVPAIFVFAALCQWLPQAGYADEPLPVGGNNEANLAAALKRLSRLGGQSAESDTSAMDAYSVLGLASVDKPEEKVDEFYARQGIPMNEEVRRSLGADLFRREVEQCRRSGKSTNDCLKQVVSKMKELGKSTLLDRLVTSIEKSPLETLQSMQSPPMSAEPEWPEIKPQRGPTSAGGTTTESGKSIEPTFLTLKGHTNTVDDGVFSTNDRMLATVSADKTVRLWDTQSGTLLRTLEDHSGGLGSVALSPDGRTGASDSLNAPVKVWDVQTGALKYTLAIYGQRIAFSPDGNTLATQNGDSEIKLWDAQTGVLKQTLSYGQTQDRSRRFEIRDITFSPDGNTLAGTGGALRQLGEIVLWNISTGALQKRLTGHSDIAQKVAISPDGKMAASGSLDGTLILWDMQTGQVKHTLAGHTLIMTSLAFSSDSQTLASGNFDRTVKLWNVQTGTLKQTVTKDSWMPQGITFLPDGKTILVASSGSNYDVLLWRVPVN